MKALLSSFAIDLQIIVDILVLGLIKLVIIVPYLKQ